jgi:hypothetical protein
MRMLCGAIRVVGLEMLGVSLVLWAIFAVAGVAGESLGLTAPRPLQQLRTLLSLSPDPISNTHPRMMSVSEDELAVSRSVTPKHTAGRRTLSHADHSPWPAKAVGNRASVGDQ